MTISRTALSLAAALSLLACSAGGTGEPPADTDATPSADAAPPPVDVGEVPGRAAAAICDALFRCCDDDLAAYFAPYRASKLLAAFRDRLPPAVALDEGGCREVVTEMLDVVPLGDWVRAAQSGAVEYDAAAFGACLGALDAAACGAPARAALWDSTCLGFAAPAGGLEQRSFFHRSATAGTACTPIRDGVGAAFYGTCDPLVAFCCYDDPASEGCAYPFDGDGAARPGTCAATAAEGTACSMALPLALCATGQECDADEQICVAPANVALAVGDACVDDGFHLLGDCTASWCDLLGSGRCEPLREDGIACGADHECRSERCETVCVAMDLCTGTPDAPGPDAGVPDATPDEPDAGTQPADGERCETALDLEAASSPSPRAGYSHRVAASFGAADDYNPLMESGLPPACAFAYDGRGKEVVYAVTLSPGDRLRLHAELVDGEQAGIYLLDTCPGASWPDFDLTGACGSNEYDAGFCGPVACEPATLDILYPTTVGDGPTTFWVVIDEVAGDASTGFVLDWQILHP